MAEEILQQIRDEMERAYRPPDVPKQKPAEAGDSPALGFTPLRLALGALNASYASVGQPPPEPPTFRGRVGAQLVKLVRRMLFWYTPQIVYFQYSALRVLEEQGKILERSESRIRRLEAELAEQRAQNQDLRQAWEDFERTMAAPASSFQAGERGDADARAAKSREG